LKRLAAEAFSAKDAAAGIAKPTTAAVTYDD
jgi:hypothetical protein